MTICLDNVPVNSIQIPPYYQRVCANWAGGQGCMLYAVSSTGNLTTGTTRPWGCESDEEWYYTIWCEFAADVWSAIKLAEKAGSDYGDLAALENYVDNIVEGLASVYGLED